MIGEGDCSEVVPVSQWQAKPIAEHEGRKYLRLIKSSTNEDEIWIDVYCVLESFAVTCPARAHAIKKLLCCGARGKGDAIADLVGVLAAVNRAIELEQKRTKKES